MFEPLQRATLFALYQMTVMAGILLLPVAVLARRAGIPIPLHRVMGALERAYRNVERKA